MLASDNYYFTDLPFYVLGRALFGNQLWLIYVVPFCVYGLLLGTSAWLVWRNAASSPQAAAVLLLLIGVPFAPGQFMFLVSAFHTATVLFSLISIAAIAPVLREERCEMSRYLLFCAAAFIACASDPMADVFLGVPLLLFPLLEALRRRHVSRRSLILAGGTIFVLFCATRFPGFVSQAGGFTSKPSFANAIVPEVTGIFGNARAIIAAFGVLFGIRDIPAVPFAPVISFIRAVAMLWVFVSVASVLRRAPVSPTQIVARFIAIGALCLLGADDLSITFSSAISQGTGYPNAAVRYVAPAYLLLCIAAALAPMPLPAAAAGRRLLGGGAWIAGALQFAILGTFCLHGFFGPPGLKTVPAYDLTRWLQARELTYGVGEYYTTQLVRALSRGQVMADPIFLSHGRLKPNLLATDTTRFDMKARPQFIIFPPNNWDDLTEAEAVKSYGPPASRVSVQGVDVLLYGAKAPE